jgi:hypothetical protein
MSGFRKRNEEAKWVLKNTLKSFERCFWRAAAA